MVCLRFPSLLLATLPRQPEFRVHCFFPGRWVITLERPFIAICNAALCSPRWICLSPANNRVRYRIYRSSGQTFVVRPKHSPSKGGSSSAANCASPDRSPAVGHIRGPKRVRTPIPVNRTSRLLKSDLVLLL